jgi:endogenous inhibitor of DNA gyrase (YacG/DUF329 family)
MSWSMHARINRGHDDAKIATSSYVPPMAQAAPTTSCPICGKPTDPVLKPFCSKRCRDVDLNRWLSGVYAVPVKDEENEDEAPMLQPKLGDDQ